MLLILLGNCESRVRVRTRRYRWYCEKNWSFWCFENWGFDKLKCLSNYKKNEVLDVEKK